MDQPTAYVVLIVCASLLYLIGTLVVSYWIIRAAVSGALAKHRDELREILRDR
ncbi:hypothetical protein [Microbacterium enclense]|uniref:Uncharacterized protein n=1 Tax=Microbacterium enclense TaxID=993073 RepID=A0A1G6NWI7_9MICO|nr:hypothetical protein [Microbacterium enclense]SDC72001.1 hypothetical protein SAMN05216418_2872 [Microbacterium enclense]